MDSGVRPGPGLWTLLYQSGLIRERGQGRLPGQDQLPNHEREDLYGPVPSDRSGSAGLSRKDRMPAVRRTRLQRPVPARTCLGDAK